MKIARRSVRGIRNSTYFRRILSGVIVFIVLLIAVLSMALSNRFESHLTKYQALQSMRTLSLMQRNIQQTSDAVRSLGVSLTQETYVANLMYGSNFSYDKLAMWINVLRQRTVGALPYIQAVHIYRRETDSFFTTNQGLYYTDEILRQAMFDHVDWSGPRHPYLTNMPVNTLSGAPRVDALAYAFPLYGGDHRLDAALMLYVHPDWIYSGLENSEGILLTDGQGHFMGGNALTAGEREALTGITGESGRAAILTVGGETVYATVLYMRKLGWYVIALQTEAQVMSLLTEIRHTIAWVSLVLLLIALSFALLLSLRIYRPFGDLLNFVSDGEREERGTRQGDMEYLHGVYRRNLDQLGLLQTQQREQMSALRTYYLRQLLLESNVEAQRYATEQRRFDLLIDQARKVSVVIASIDDYKTFCGKYDPRDQALLRYAMLNACHERLSAVAPCESIDMKEDHVVFLAQAEAELSPQGRFEDALRDAQGYIEREYAFSFSAALSRPCALEEITDGYGEGLRALPLRFLLGHRCVITPQALDARAGARAVQMLPQIPDALRDAIRSGDDRRAVRLANELFDAIARMDYNSAYLSAMVLCRDLSLLDETMRADGAARGKGISALANVYASAQNISTLEGIRECVLRALAAGTSVAREAENTRHILLTEAVIEIVESEFRNPMLGLQSVADTLALSTAHVSRVFKSVKGVPLPDFITRYRLSCAAKALLEQSDSVSEIAKSVGIENSSYFYKLFRKQYRVTPMEFRLKYRASR
jgi:AraC-like DNA-binding protein